MRWLRRLLFLVVALVAGVYVAGTSMPREHSASSRIRLTAPRDSVWAVLRAFGDYPKWNTDFTSSVKGERVNGHEVWVQEVGGMTMRVALTDVQAPSRLVSEIVSDEQSQWGGTWIYELASVGAGTEVTVTENGWVKSPIFRVMMTLRGAHATMDAVLTHLGARFGEQVTPEHLKVDGGG